MDLCSFDEEGDSDVEIIDEDPPVDEYTEEERAWMEQDIGNWQGDFEYVEDGQARASGSGGGVKSAAKPAAKDSSSSNKGASALPCVFSNADLDDAGKKRGIETSDDESKPQKGPPEEGCQSRSSSRASASLASVL